MKKKIFIDDKIFIAGASGMVGSAIFRNLLRSGYGDRKKGGIIFTPSRKEINLLNLDEVQKWFQLHKPTVVIIAAAKVGGIFANSSQPTEFLLENLRIQTNIIETAWKSGVRRLLFLGSSCVYPKNSIQPIKEDELLKSSLEKTNEWYALAKISGIKLCQALRKQYGFDAISLMPTNLYGKGDNYHSSNSHVLPALLDRFHKHKLEQKEHIECWGSGNPRREFMHVDDLADATIFALENWDPNKKNAPLDQSGEPLNWLNVGTGIDLSIKELAEMILKKINSNSELIYLPLPEDDPLQRKPVIEKAKHLLDWHPKVKLERGLENTINYFKENI